MKNVTVRLSDSQIEQFDQLAKANNTTRAEILRRRITETSLKPDSLHRVTLAIRKRLNGVFTVQQAEQAAAVCYLHYR